jgi:hypothetical protein
MADIFGIDEELLKTGDPRSLLIQAVRAYGQPVDRTEVSEYAQAEHQRRQQQADNDMVLAMAANFAGKNFSPVSQGYLSRALKQYGPEKIGDDLIIDQGNVIGVPGAGRKEGLGVIESIGRQSWADQRSRAAQDRADARAVANRNADNVFGAGASPQLGADEKGNPVYKDQRTGKPFTYVNGVPTLYGGPLKPKASNAQPSEDERKAAGWVAQAGMAVKNMDAALKLDPKASIQSFGEVVTSKIPFVGEEITNANRTAARQMFSQASDSMAEALLRAATGAGINESEAKQKVRELVPAFGDKPENIQQKKRGYAIYMATLRARAGRALPALEMALEEIEEAQDSILPEDADEDGVIDLD